MDIKLKKENKTKKIVYTLALSLIVIAIGIFFMSKKEDLDFDEVGTFGLANNTFQLHIEDFKEYTGNELLLNYTAVKEGEEFNLSNVFFNQKMDTHPPLYYLILNFVCSLRSGTFSMWYGLIINLFFMVLLFFEMRYLLYMVTKDKVMATILSLISFFTYGLINEIVFIRMYVQLSVVSMAFVILIIKEINYISENNNLKDSKSDNKEVISVNSDSKIYSKHEFYFLIKFLVVCIIGILTQYHFALVAFYFSFIFAIFLINKKEFKMLFKTFFVGVASILISLLIFPGIINHLFGESSLHALNGQRIDSMSKRFYDMFATVIRAFFGMGIYAYIVILLILIIAFFVVKFKNKLAFKSIISDNKWYFIILLSVLFYYILISLTTTFTFARYLYNIYPLIIVSIIAPIYLLFKSFKSELKYLSVLILILLAFSSRVKEEPFSLNLGQNQFYEFLNNNKDVKILALYRSIDKNGRNDTMGTSLWKIQRPVYTFRCMESVSFVDMSKNNEVLYNENNKISQNDRLFIVIYTGENDDEILGGIMSANGFTVVDRIIRTTYYNMYIVSRE